MWVWVRSDVLRGAVHIRRRLISQSFVGIIRLAAGNGIDCRGGGQHRLSALTSSDLGIADHAAEELDNDIYIYP